MQYVLKCSFEWYLCINNVKFEVMQSLNLNMHVWTFIPVQRKQNVGMI